MRLRQLLGAIDDLEKPVLVLLERGIECVSRISGGYESEQAKQENINAKFCSVWSFAVIENIYQPGFANKCVRM